MKNFKNMKFLKSTENSSDYADTLSPDVVFHGGSFGKGLRAVRAQIGMLFRIKP